MKTSFLQSQLAYNAATITALIYERKDTISDAKLALDIGDGALAHMDFKAALRLRLKIKNMATIQRAIKEEIKAARTTKRVYKKHPPVRAQARGGLILPIAAASAD